MDPAKIVKEIVDMQDPESKVLKEEDLVVEVLLQKLRIVIIVSNLI